MILLTIKYFHYFFSFFKLFLKIIFFTKKFIKVNSLK